MTHSTEAATVTIAEAARILGIGRDTAYGLVRQGVIPSLQLGRRIVVPKVGLDRMLNEAGQANEERI